MCIRDSPYSSPNTVSQTVLTTGGQAVSGGSATTPTQSVDQTILLGNMPLSRTVSTVATDSENRYFIEGAYYTLRIGPTLIMPLGSKWKLSVSAGPDIIYSGSELNVLENLTFEEGEAPITDPVSYTHLDVYKRQTSSSSTARPTSCARRSAACSPRTKSTSPRTPTP